LIIKTKNSPTLRPVDQLVATLDDALDLLQEFSHSGETVRVSSQSPASLLEQCLLLCAQQQSVTPEPIRLVHHFACTGGTLFCKCLAAMPNVQLLSEVDPLSTMLEQPNKPRFAATDMVTLMRQSTRGAKPEQIIELFLNNLEIIQSDAVAQGQRLIVRDHAHSHFCFGGEILVRPSLRAMVASRFPIRSVVTVRHPLDSFLSLEENGWVTFWPPTFDEYCERYIAFLDAYEGVPVVKYESFIAAPHEVMRKICLLLEVPYSDQFIDLFSVFKLTGESGRGANFIAYRPRRPVHEALSKESDQSHHYRILQAKLNYGE
jgi:hypothetical protein